MNNNGIKSKNIQRENSSRHNGYEKYEEYAEPVIITDLSFKVLYKNATAEASLARQLQTVSNIKHILSPGNLRRLRDAVKRETAVIIAVNTAAPFNCAAVAVDTVRRYVNENMTLSERVVVFTFFASGDFSKKYGEVRRAEDIMLLHSNKLMTALKVACYSAELLDNSSLNKDAGSPIPESDKRYMKSTVTNLKKFMRARLHFEAYIANSKIYYDKTEQAYHNIAVFFDKLKRIFSQCTQCTDTENDSKFETASKNIMIRIQERDIFMMNMIVIGVALKHSLTGTVNQCFSIDTEIKSGIVRYDFTPSETFINLYKDKFSPEYLDIYNLFGNLDICLDLQLALLIASNNNASLELRSDGKENKVIFEIVISGKYCTKISKSRGRCMSDAEIQQLVDIELAALLEA